MRPVLERLGTIAAALPARLVAHAAVLGGRRDVAERLRRRTSHVPGTAVLATAPAWFLVVFRGVLYPAFGADNLEQSWGGPTLLGAWVTHLAIAVVVLVAVSLVAAVATSGPGQHRKDGATATGDVGE